MIVKQKIPKAIREQVWLTYIGKKFENKCYVFWCSNIITPFTYEVGHNIPESKGGATMIDNLRPICRSCNGSMGNQYSIDEWNKLSERAKNPFECFRFKCLS
jgi:5-methylcytosine-specific restriction endonuclease McrA